MSAPPSEAISVFSNDISGSLNAVAGDDNVFETGIVLLQNRADRSFKVGSLIIGRSGEGGRRTLI